MANYTATGNWYAGGSTSTTPTPPPTTTPPSTTTAPITQSIGTGPDSLVLKISQDAYNGNAQYTVSVDGVQVGGTLTAGALHGSGQDDTLTVLGDWAAGAHTVSVNFLNDAYGGTATTDRNLYVDSATYNGAAVAGATAALMSAGPSSFGFTDTSAPPGPVSQTIGSGVDSLVLKISQDAYLGNAQYTISVDGVQVGGTLTAAALHGAGQDDSITVLGNWAAGAHKVTVNFLNDAYGGTATTDRNLYVDSATYNGATVSGAKASLLSAGPVDLGFTDLGSTGTGSGTGGGTAGTGPDTLVVKISQDAYEGNAQYTIKIDGVQVGGVMTANSLHGSGQDDLVTLNGDWGTGVHTVAVSFVNDLYGAGGDRNLYVDGASYNGKALTDVGFSMLSNDTKHFGFYQAPQNADPKSFTVVAQDDFSHGYNSQLWGDPFPLPYPISPSSNYAGYFDPSAVQVQNGELTVTTSRQPDGSWHTGAFSSYKAGFGITYGTVAFDAKVEYAQGTTFAFLMWPVSDRWPPEIDILETPTNRAMHTLHWGGSLSDSSVKFGGPDPTAWHHYELTWLPDLVQVKTDGEVVASWNYNVPNVPMGFGVLGYIGGQQDGWMGGAPNSTTPNAVTAHLDNVVISQWNGIA